MKGDGGFDFFVLYTYLSIPSSFRPIFSPIAGTLHVRLYISFVVLLAGKTSFSHLQKGTPPLGIGMGIT